MNLLTEEEEVQHRPSSHLVVDWTVSVTTLIAIGVAFCGFLIEHAILSSRVSTVEQTQVAQAVSNEKLASAVGRLDITLTRVQAQVEERQRAAEVRMDRNDLEMDRAALRHAK
jgi:hypothetical protein